MSESHWLLLFTLPLAWVLHDLPLPVLLAGDLKLSVKFSLESLPLGDVVRNEWKIITSLNYN